MDIGRIRGSVWATVKDRRFEGIPLLIIEPLDAYGRPSGDWFIAADSIGVGEGELIYYETSREAPFAFPEAWPAVDAAIVGVLDELFVPDPEKAPEGSQ